MIHVLIRYLGIKTKLLNAISSKISDLAPKGSVVLDMFAGSNIVGQFLKNDYVVYSNDYQKYSYIVAKTLIEDIPQSTLEGISLDKIVKSSFYKENLEFLSSAFERALNYENDIIGTADYTGEKFDEFQEFYNNSPYYGFIEGKHHAFDSSLDYFEHSFIDRYKNNNKLFPYILFTAYYNNPYFSLKQSIEIDSVRYAIDKLCETKQIDTDEYNIYLSCLIYVLHNIVISVGDHFAQPQKIQEVALDLSGDRDNIHIRERKKILTKKRLSVTDLLNEKILEYKNNYTHGSVKNNAFNCDYRNLFSKPYSDLIKNVDVIYIDPPYTNAHYSRFYHIPETLVNYDYPEISFFGRYRTDRFQSNFCIKSKAYAEFSHMISKCREINSKIVISYSDTSQCVLNIEEIKEICQKYYPDVIAETIDHMYRNFGQKPNKILAKEYLITCTLGGDHSEKIFRE